jgi:hypothetical protein
MLALSSAPRRRLSSYQEIQDLRAVGRAFASTADHEPLPTAPFCTTLVTAVPLIQIHKLLRRKRFTAVQRGCHPRNCRVGSVLAWADLITFCRTSQLNCHSVRNTSEQSSNPMCFDTNTLLV